MISDQSFLAASRYIDRLVLNNIMPVTNDSRLSRTLLYMRTYTANEKKPIEANNDIKLYIRPNLRGWLPTLYTPLSRILVCAYGKKKYCKNHG